MMTTASPLDRLDTMQRIELAAGVEVELHPAGPVVRAKAWLLDLMWIVLCYLLGGMLFMLFSMVAGFEAGQGLHLLFAFFMSWGYAVVFEVKRGATPGKKSCGLKVVMTSGAPVTWTASILRNLLRVADFLPSCYVTGLVSCLFSRRFQRLGDLVADTMVVYRQPDAAPVFQPQESVPVPAVVPTMALSWEERASIIRFNENLGMWSESRRGEMAGQLSLLTGTSGPEGVQRLAGIGTWLRDS
jgi:uncharacterized RDD family membrane protein YckC